MGYLLGASLIWSFSFGLVAEQLKVMDSYQLAAARLWLSALAFSLPGLLLNKIELSGKLKGQLMLLGVIQFGVMYVLYIKAYQYLQAWEVALWTITTPIWVLICSGGEKTVTGITAGVLATFGAYFLKPIGTQAALSYQGILLIQAANLCFALGQVIYRRLDLGKTNPTKIFFWLYLGAALFTTIPCLIWPSDQQLTALRIDDILRLFYLGIVASGLGFAAWNHGATKVTTSILAVWNNLKIPIAIGVSFLFFDDLPNQPARTAIGAAILVLALVLAHRKSPLTGKRIAHALKG